MISRTRRRCEGADFDENKYFYDIVNTCMRRDEREKKKHIRRDARKGQRTSRGEAKAMAHLLNSPTSVMQVKGGPSRVDESQRVNFGSAKDIIDLTRMLYRES